MEIKFETGDVVLLKSCGPYMTVVSTDEKGFVSCVWFERANGNFGNLMNGSFHFKTLKISNN
jgi:uncharacterized protein YodC (DUF2158 family)